MDVIACSILHTLKDFFLFFQCRFVWHFERKKWCFVFRFFMTGIIILILLPLNAESNNILLFVFLSFDSKYFDSKLYPCYKHLKKKSKCFIMWMWVVKYHLHALLKTRGNKTLFFKIQKQTLRNVLQNSCSEICSQNP